jgi:hypothetical protein
MAMFTSFLYVYQRVIFSFPTDTSLSESRVPKISSVDQPDPIEITKISCNFWKSHTFTLSKTWWVIQFPIIDITYEASSWWVVQFPKWYPVNQQTPKRSKRVSRMVVRWCFPPKISRCPTFLSFWGCWLTNFLLSRFMMMYLSKMGIIHSFWITRGYLLLIYSGCEILHR